MNCYKCLVVSEEDEKMFAGGQGFNLDFTTVVAYCGFIGERGGSFLLEGWLVVIGSHF